MDSPNEESDQLRNPRSGDVVSKPLGLLSLPDDVFLIGGIRFPRLREFVERHHRFKCPKSSEAINQSFGVSSLHVSSGAMTIACVW